MTVERYKCYAIADLLLNQKVTKVELAVAAPQVDSNLDVFEVYHLWVFGRSSNNSTAVVAKHSSAEVTPENT